MRKAQRDGLSIPPGHCVPFFASVVKTLGCDSGSLVHKLQPTHHCRNTQLARLSQECSMHKKLDTRTPACASHCSWGLRKQCPCRSGLELSVSCKLPSQNGYKYKFSWGPLVHICEIKPNLNRGTRLRSHRSSTLARRPGHDPGICDTLVLDLGVTSSSCLFKPTLARFLERSVTYRGVWTTAWTNSMKGTCTDARLENWPQRRHGVLHPLASTQT